MIMVIEERKPGSRIACRNDAAAPSSRPMRITKADKASNRVRIVETASRLFRERGMHSVGIADLMKEAGFTHGGFYNHFESKEALTAEVWRTALASGNACFADSLTHGDPDATWKRYVTGYLSPEHRDGSESGCVVGALVGELAHEPAAVQSCVVGGSEAFLAQLTGYFARRYRLSPRNARRRAITTWTSMLGALTLARAVVRADPGFSDEVLRVCRERLTR